MTNSSYTEIVAILDRSGSMQEIKEQTEAGFNGFITEQKLLPGKCLVTLVQFDDRYEQVYAGRAIAEVPRLRLEPRGSTALLDAVGRTVIETGVRLEAMAENDRPAHVVCVILTDGLENASTKWTSEQVWSAVNHQTEIYGWTFMYLGANQDAIKTGEAIGVPQSRSLTYTGANVQEVWRATSRALGDLRSGGDAAYTDRDRDLVTATSR